MYIYIYIYVIPISLPLKSCSQPPSWTRPGIPTAVELGRPPCPIASFACSSRPGPGDFKGKSRETTGRPLKTIGKP